jgi:hypothetical protein
MVDVSGHPKFQQLKTRNQKSVKVIEVMYHVGRNKDGLTALFPRQETESEGTGTSTQFALSSYFQDDNIPRNLRYIFHFSSFLPLV